MPVETFGLAALDHRHLWHPFTQMEEWLGETPLVIERGEGAHLYDTEGQAYLDATSSIWCAVHGHNHPKMNEAIVAQLSKVGHTTLLGLSHGPSVILAEKLASKLPEGLNRLFYSDSGAGAVEAALKIAVQYWHANRQRYRTHFLALEGAYHGDTLGSVSVGYSEVFHRAFKLMTFPVYRIQAPYVIHQEEKISMPEAEAKSLSQAEAILKKHASKIAACIVEPMVQGAAGIWPHSSDYLKRLYALVKAHQALFIADEVAVGFGRTGSLFAVNHAGITPDLLCLGKALSGGYLPLSATVATEEIFNAFRGKFEEFRQFFHGHTFSGNPLGCAAGIASLEIFETERTIERLPLKIKFLWNFLDQWFRSHPHVIDVRGHGFFVGIEIGKHPTQNYPIEYRAGKKIMTAARKRGILLRPLLDTIVLAPPLNISEESLGTILNGVLKSIEEVCA